VLEKDVVDLGGIDVHATGDDQVGAPIGQVEEAGYSMRSTLWLRVVRRTRGSVMPQRGRIGGGVIVSLIGIAALVIFMIQNTEKIRVHFLVWHFIWSLWIIVLVSAVIGALAWFGGGVVRRYRRGR
jgi:uncharacterized integral membrane protein